MATLTHSYLRRIEPLTPTGVDVVTLDAVTLNDDGTETYGEQAEGYFVGNGGPATDERGRADTRLEHAVMTVEVAPGPYRVSHRQVLRADVPRAWSSDFWVIVDGDSDLDELTAYRSVDALRRAIDQASLSATIVTQVSLARGLVDAGAPLTIPTYDDDPNTAHPSVVEVPSGIGGYRYWMAHTPYPTADRENPSILASHNGIDWETPAGLTNPVVPRSEIEPTYSPDYCYGSDTHLIVNGDELWLYYRIGTPAGKNAVYLKTSTDGVTWSTATKVVEDLTEEVSMLSPCIELEDDGSFAMWCADYTTAPPKMTRRTSADGLSWSAPTDCTLPTGALIWHMDVKRIGATYYCLMNSAEEAQGDKLYYFTSDDGLVWTGDVKVPAVETAGGSFPVERFYRSCLVPRVGSDVTWDVYTNMIATIDEEQVWRIGLLRDTALPTQAQDRTRFALEQGRTDALFGVGRWIAGDSFARANSTTTLGSAATGQAWTILTGTAGIIDRSAYGVSNCRVYVETGASDVELGFDVAAVAEAWLLFRVSDGSNWLRAGIENSTGRLFIQKFVAGALSNLHAGSGSYASDLQARVGDRLRLVAVGDTISLYRNSALVVTVTDAFNSTATKHGLSIGTASRVKAFAAGTP